MKRSDCQQNEAFCLMLYQDQITGELEIVWNSRDAITPFGMRSRAGNDSVHVAWPSDLFSPFHVPAIGDRVFVDLTIDVAREQRRQYVERFWADPGAPMSERWASKAAAIEDLAHGDVAQFGGHCPHVAVVDAEMQRAFFEAARQRLEAA